MKEKRENKDGIVYRTKQPKMQLMEDWQLKLKVAANTNREDFSSDKEYNDYINQHTRYAIDEQKAKFKQAYKELG